MSHKAALCNHLITYVHALWAKIVNVIICVRIWRLKGAKRSMCNQETKKYQCNVPKQLQILLNKVHLYRQGVQGPMLAEGHSCALRLRVTVTVPECKKKPTVITIIVSIKPFMHLLNTFVNHT